jgi:hypothetical protein
MRLRCLSLSLLAMVAVSGCATTSDVYDMGGGRYGLTSSAYTSMGGVGKARSSSIKKANDYCATRGKRAVIEDTKADASFASGTSEIAFRCE